MSLSPSGTRLQRPRSSRGGQTCRPEVHEQHCIPTPHSGCPPLHRWGFSGGDCTRTEKTGPGGAQCRLQSPGSCGFRCSRAVRAPHMLMKVPGTQERLQALKSLWTHSQTLTTSTSMWYLRTRSPTLFPHSPCTVHSLKIKRINEPHATSLLPTWLPAVSEGSDLSALSGV